MGSPKKALRRSSNRAKSSRRVALENVLDLFREWGRQGGRKRAKQLSPDARRRIAQKAAQARWKRKKGRNAQS